MGEPYIIANGTVLGKFTKINVVIISTRKLQVHSANLQTCLTILQNLLASYITGKCSTRVTKC